MQSNRQTDGLIRTRRRKLGVQRCVAHSVGLDREPHESCVMAGTEYLPSPVRIKHTEGVLAGHWAVQYGALVKVISQLGDFDEYCGSPIIHILRQRQTVPGGSHKDRDASCAKASRLRTGVSVRSLWGPTRGPMIGGV